MIACREAGYSLIRLALLATFSRWEKDSLYRVSPRPPQFHFFSDCSDSILPENFQPPQVKPLVFGLQRATPLLIEGGHYGTDKKRPLVLRIERRNEPFESAIRAGRPPRSRWYGWFE